MSIAQVLTTCIFLASNTYQVPANVLMAIMETEGGHIGQETGPNVNGTYDIGPMQVNSIWLPQLSQIWHVNTRTANIWLRDSACENIYVGTWILKQKIVESGTLYNGIANYHSANRTLGRLYANKILTKIIQKERAQYALINASSAGVQRITNVSYSSGQ